MATEYYIRIRGRVNGPFDSERLRSLIARGKVGRAHEISHDSIDWRRAAEFEELFPQTSFRQEKEAASSSEQSVEHENTAPQHNSAPVEQWYVVIDGEKTGPVSFERLQAQVGSGHVNENSMVWSKGMSGWQTASTIPGLIQQVERETASSDSELSWSTMFPFFRIFNDGAWSLPWVQCLAIALLFPLLVLEYCGPESITLIGASLAFTLYFSLLWTAFFHWCFRPEKAGALRLVGVWFLTATIGVICAVLLSLISIGIFGAPPEGDGEASLLRRVIAWTVGVGLVEEAAKLGAVLLLLLFMKSELMPRTIAFMGIVSGLAFGTVEAVMYTQQYAAAHSQNNAADQIAYGEFVMLLMLRWISLPLLHATWTGIASFWVGYSRHASSHKLRWIATGWLAAGLLHGIYNAGVSSEGQSWMGVVVATASLMLLLGYLRSEESLVQQFSDYQPKAVVE